MRIVMALPVALAAVLVVAASPSRPAQVTVDARAFKPARIAVVNISEVFENYEKKKDIEAKLETEIKEEEKKFTEKQDELKNLQSELKNVQEGTERHKEITVKIRTLEYDLKSWEKGLVKDFQDKQMNALKEIRNEITADIGKYASGLEIDLVLEKQVAAEGKGSSVRWPIVHYVKQELEITEDIVKRLNANYGKPGVPAPSNVQRNAEGKSKGTSKKP